MIAEASSRLEEIVLHKEFDVNQAISDIRFYFTLAQKTGEQIIVEIWRKMPPKEEGG